MIRCLIDEDSFVRWEGTHPHQCLNQLSDQLELVVELLKENQVLDLPDELVIVVTCNRKLLPWKTPGQHCPTTQTVYLSGVYEFTDLARYLAHELIHVEQTHQGKLHYDPDQHALCWFDQPHEWGQRLSYAEYRALPWERDAWAREPAVIEALAEIIEDEQCLNDMVAIRNVKRKRGLLH